MTVYIFDARGNTEDLNRNMLTGVINQIRRAHPDVVIEHIPHTASLGVLTKLNDPLAPSGDNCATQIVTELGGFIKQLKPWDKFIVLGYSLGCVGVTRWLKLTGGDPRCIMVGLLANPSRKAGTTYGALNGVDTNPPPLPHIAELRSGIYSTQGTGTVDNTLTSPIPLVEIANPNDVMTSCPKRSPLHAFAGPIMAFSFAKPLDLVKQLKDDGIDEVIGSMVRPDNWLNPGWWSWPADLIGYMQHTHTSDYWKIKLFRDSAGKPISGIDLLARQANWRIGRAVAA